MEIPNDLVEKIANYLGTKPYFEVVGLISQIRKASREENKPNSPNKES